MKLTTPALCLALFASACVPNHSERPKQPFTADSSHLVSLPGGRFGVALGSDGFAEITYVADTAKSICFLYTEQPDGSGLMATASLIDCCRLVTALPASARAWGASLHCPAAAVPSATITPGALPVPSAAHSQ